MSDGEAPGVGEALGSAGPCPVVEWRGRAWKIGHPVQRAKAELEALVAARAVNEVRALKGVVDPQAHAEMMADVLRLITAREYRTWGRGWSAAIQGPDGNMLFLLSLLRAGQPDATEADAIGMVTERGDEVAVAFAQVIPDFLRALTDGMAVTEEDRERLVRHAVATFMEAFSSLSSRLRQPASPTVVTS